ncbi:MAG: hypothetical protein FWC75_08200 [Oscillospiraceae bacterium]|nr:hypothetical protein [Oscillospiraceae bacterium]
MTKTKRISFATVGFVLLLSLIMPTLAFANEVTPAADGSNPISAVAGTLGEVHLITGDVVEIEFDAPILNAQQAREVFTIRVDGNPVAWTFLSFFDFGAYGERGGVVNIRLDEALDAGEPRGRRREIATSEAWLAQTDHVRGPIAAARLTVAVGDDVATAQWVPFYTERNFGHMSRVLTYISGEGGNNGRVAGAIGTVTGTGSLHQTLPPNTHAMNIFGPNMEPRYNEEFVVRQVGEGLHRFFGRGEFLALPMVRSGFHTLIVGPAQSVYEAPQFRDLYIHGVTDDTFTRRSIKATSVPGNFDSIYGSFERPFIVVTSDDVMRHDSPMNAYGETIFTIDENGQRVYNEDMSASRRVSARPRSDFFYLGEALFDFFWEVGARQGSRQFPLGPNNYWDDFRFDLHIERAFDNAIAQGLWPNTILTATHDLDGTPFTRAERIKNFYMYGAMVFWEFMPESRYFDWMSMPINTRGLMYYYDYDLYWALSGLHGREEFWTGVGNGQQASSVDDTSKWRTPWFRDNQPDHYGLPACFNNRFNVGAPCAACVAGTCAEGVRGVPHAPLYITDVVVSSHNQIMVYFNRVVHTRAAAVNPNNFQIWIGDTMVPANLVSQTGGYHWNSIRLQTDTGGVNWVTGTVPREQWRLDNGRPYGRFFNGFTQADLDERSIANGGWLADNQPLGRYPLAFGEFVDLARAIDEFGAGMRPEGVSIVYTGTAPITVSNTVHGPNVLGGPIRDWAGNELSRQGERIPARFEPWQAVAYRSALTGLYTYLDTTIGTHPRHPFSQKDVAITATLQMEALFQNNTDVTYNHLASAILGWDGTLDASGNRNMVNGFQNAFPDGLLFETLVGGTGQMGNSQTPAGTQWFYDTSVRYDRPGQRIADGAVRASGGMHIAAGSVRGRHPGRLPFMNQMHTNNVGDLYRIGGWGGNNFQTEDIHVMRDFNLDRYRIENLVLHEGGHGIDSFQRGLGFGHEMYADMTSAHSSAINPANGRRWFTVDNVAAYLGPRNEYVSTAANYWAGTMRESFSGTNDGVWTPVSTREEFFRYDPWGFEAWRRLSWNGELGLWFNDANGNPQVGNPQYRVMLEDWELLRDQNPEFAHWRNSSYLMAWGASIMEVAHHNPYTEARNNAAVGSQMDNRIRWVSWNVPHIWDVYPNRLPSNPSFPNNRFDFAGADFQATGIDMQRGGTPHHAMPPFGTVPVAQMTPLQNQTHPFHRTGGVQRPIRTPEIAALAAPVAATVVEDSIRIPSRPILVAFEITDFGDDVITNNNVQTSFDLKINGQYTHFYFWDFEVHEVEAVEDESQAETATIATVTLRLDWPLASDAVISVIPRAASVPAHVLTYTVFAEDWRESINIRFFLDGAPIDIPLADMELVVDDVVIENMRDFTLNIADWQTAQSAVFICKLRNNWEHLTLTVTSHDQTLSFAFTNSMFVVLPELSFNIFNNGNSNNESLANLGVIRMWTQLDGVNALVPYAALDITATLPNGQDAMEFVRINRVWNDSDNVSLIDVRKDQAWQYIYFTATLFGTTVEVLLINDLYVSVTDVFGMHAFNNGNDNNASLANMGIIRIWMQLNGINTPVSYADLRVYAADQDGYNAMEFVRVNRIWNDPDHVNIIDVTKVGADWQTIDLTVSLGSQTLVLPLINNSFEP